MSNGEASIDHSRNSRENSVAKSSAVPPRKIRNNNPVEPKNHTHKPGRQNGIGTIGSCLTQVVPEHTVNPLKKDSSLVTKKTDISYVRSFNEFKSDKCNVFQKMSVTHQVQKPPSSS
ncbi:hypothetical protein Tco_0180302 [Tanacetum coccineum]